jgi:hypothetical protein
MNNKHTKGKWIKRGLEIIGPYGSNKHICEITGNFMSEEEGNANASLIAAAPELLNALQVLVNICSFVPKEVFTEMATNDFNVIIKNAKSAIQKAKA